MTLRRFVSTVVALLPHPSFSSAYYLSSCFSAAELVGCALVRLWHEVLRFLLPPFPLLETFSKCQADH
jgi:hypothetical protein